MKRMIKHIAKACGYVIVTATFISACTLNDVSDELSNELSPEEIEAASQIMGQALSDDNDGIFGSLNDALSTVSDNGFGGIPAKLKDDDDDDDDDYSGRGGEQNYQHHYDPASGTHTISFDRKVNTPNFQKNLSALMTYIFTDTDGNYVEYPRQNQDQIEDILFTSSKNGDVTNRFRSSEFSRTDTFAISGVSDATPILRLDGYHFENGSFNGVSRNGNTFERSYVTEISLLDIEINKDTVAFYGSLEQGVTGTLSYEMNIFRNSNGDESTKTTTGTIQMDGDGTALLRFQNISQLFEVNLSSGIVTNDEDELEADVTSVDPNNQTVMLSNEVMVIISTRTEIDGDDGLETLEDVALALSNGFSVIAEVEGYISPENSLQFIADEIEFEFKDEDEDEDEDEEEDDEEEDNDDDDNDE